jgi:hypothetical protein
MYCFFAINESTPGEQPAPPSKRRWPIRVAALVCALSALAGCHRSDRPPLGHVQGTVTLKGKPLGGALVVFQPAKGHISTATTDDEGHYDLVYLAPDHGAIVGTHTVKISTLSEECKKELVPIIYNRNSTVKKEVVAGENPPIDFELK